MEECSSLLDKNMNGEVLQSGGGYEYEQRRVLGRWI